MIKRIQNRRSRLPTGVFAIAMMMVVAGCQQAGKNVPGDSNDHRPWQGITEQETVHFTGTEPFWGGTVAGTKFSYSTPDDPKGAVIEVSRFAGRGGLSFSGELEGQAMTMAITPGTCSDGMSDRSYPFSVTLDLGRAVRNGCGWTDRQPFTGGE